MAQKNSVLYIPSLLYLLSQAKKGDIEKAKYVLKESGKLILRGEELPSRP